MSKQNKKVTQANNTQDPQASSEDGKKLQAHRSQVFKKARKFIYPLGHSKRLILANSLLVVVGAIFLLTAYVYAQVYIYKSESEFVYRTSQLIPLPIGSVENNKITYEEYLFELRSSKHFLETQRNVDFETTEGLSQLEDLRKLSMTKAVNVQLVENIAKANNLEVTDEEVENQISVLRSQASSFNLDGQIDGDQSNDRFIQILKQYYNWDERDLERVVKSQILQQKVMPLIDVESKNRAEEILKEINKEDKTFEDLLEASEDEVTKENEGLIGVVDDNQIIISNTFDAKVRELELNTPQIVTSEFGFHVIEVRMDEEQKKVYSIFIAYSSPSEVLAEQREKTNIELRDGYRELLSKDN